jgi:predicted transcriptional regulator
MTKFSTETKTGRLLTALQEGQALSEGQIRVRFGLKNPRATVSDIRFAGYAVYANQHKDTKGRVTTKYKLGKPSRAIVAAGYRAMSLGLA